MVRLYTLGQIDLTDADGKPLRRILAGDRRLGMLAYLALALPGTRRRDSVLAVFWPECGQTQARHRLRQLLYILRAEAGDGIIVARGQEEIGLEPTRFWCDAVEFNSAYLAGDFERCVRLHGGLFCEGLYITGSRGFERWVDVMRAGLHGRAVTAAWKLAERAANNRAILDACHWARHALELEPDEAQLRWLLELLARSGDRVQALRLADHFRHLVAREFDAELSHETLELVQRIRADTPADLPRQAFMRRSATSRLLH